MLVYSQALFSIIESINEFIKGYELVRFSLVLNTIALIIFCFVRGIGAAELLMIESASCEWCEVWHEEIGGIYSKTPEGKYAPLRRIDIADIISKDNIKIRLPSYTPTFIVMDNGKEVARILGYPGEEFFWPMLKDALEKTGFKP